MLDSCQHNEPSACFIDLTTFTDTETGVWHDTARGLCVESEWVKRALLVRRRCDRGVQLQSCAMSADSFRSLMGYLISAFRVVQEEIPHITEGLYLQSQFRFTVFASVDVIHMESRASWATV